jgi:hypothetical protein
MGSDANREQFSMEAMTLLLCLWSHVWEGGFAFVRIAGARGR